jgi:hypothetical protein
MKSALTFLFLGLSATVALAQQGVSNARDSNGNLIRNNSGLNSPGRPQVNNFNGQINLNGQINQLPPTTNAVPPSGKAVAK